MPTRSKRRSVEVVFGGDRPPALLEARMPETTQTEILDVAPAAVVEESLVEESLVEEVSIDGMCGVY